LTLTYLKRNSDAPSIRFLPGEDFLQESSGERETQASQPIALESLQSLRHIADALDCTLENLLLAGFAALLLRLTRQGSLVIVVAPSQLAVFRLEDDCTFDAIVRQAEKRTPRKEDGRQSPDQAIRYRFFAGEPSPLESSDGFRLELTVRNDGRVLDLTSPDGFWRDSTLRSWLGYLFALIGNAASNLSSPVNLLPMWDETEALHTYEQLNQTAVDFPGEAFVHLRFSLQARRTPHSTAVISAGAKYTYRELDERSDSLAQRLTAAGAGPGRSVAVCMERTAHLPMALLAVLKSGACYVPLDPHNPAGRLRGILDECAPAALLSDSTMAGALASTLKIDSLPVLCADQIADEDLVDSQPPSSAIATAPLAIEPDSLAYTIYTSGSTGVPKGVRITHRALLNLICSMWRIPGVTPADRTLAVAPSPLTSRPWICSCRSAPEAPWSSPAARTPSIPTGSRN
jgi:hypothetical protein